MLSVKIFVKPSQRRRAAVGGKTGKTGKTSVLHGFSKIERDGGSSVALLWWSYLAQARATTLHTPCATSMHVLL